MPAIETDESGAGHTEAARITASHVRSPAPTVPAHHPGVPQQHSQKHWAGSGADARTRTANRPITRSVHRLYRGLALKILNSVIAVDALRGSRRHEFDDAADDRPSTVDGIDPRPLPDRSRSSSDKTRLIHLDLTHADMGI